MFILTDYPDFSPEEFCSSRKIVYLPAASITATCLLEQYAVRCSRLRSPSQHAERLATLLAEFSSYFGGSRNPSDVVAGFGEHFDTHLVIFIHDRPDAAAGLTAETVHRCLSRFQMVYTAMGEHPARKDLPSRFADMMTYLIARRGLTTCRLLGLTGFNAATYSAGGRLSPRGLPGLIRAAAVLHVDPEWLLAAPDLIHLNYNGVRKARAAMRSQTDYGRWMAKHKRESAELRRRTGVGFVFAQGDLSAQQKQELEDLHVHLNGTVDANLNERERRTRQRLWRPLEQFILRYYAFLAHHRAVPWADLSLALWCRDDWVEDFLDQARTEAHRGHYNITHKHMARFAARLVHLRDGFLARNIRFSRHRFIESELRSHYQYLDPFCGWQPVELDRAHPSFKTQQWGHHCRTVHQRLQELGSRLAAASKRQSHRKARDCQDSLGKVLEWRNPSLVLQILKHRLRALLAVANTRLRANLYRRDEIMLITSELLASRVSEIEQLRWGRQVIPLPDGGIRFVLPPYLQKGGGYEGEELTFDLFPIEPMPGGLDPVVLLRAWGDEVLPEYRDAEDPEHPLILPRIGPANRTGATSRRLCAGELSRRMRWLTARLLPDLTKSGWSFHTVRHILAGAFKAAGAKEVANDLLRNSLQTAEDYGRHWNDSDCKRAIRLTRLMMLVPAPQDIEAAAQLEPLFCFEGKAEPLLRELSGQSRWLKAIEFAAKEFPDKSDSPLSA